MEETIDLIWRSTRKIDTKSAPAPAPATALNAATVEANGATANTAHVKATQDRWYGFDTDTTLDSKGQSIDKDPIQQQLQHRYKKRRSDHYITESATATALQQTLDCKHPITQMPDAHTTPSAVQV